MFRQVQYKSKLKHLISQPVAFHIQFRSDSHWYWHELYHQFKSGILLYWASCTQCVSDPTICEGDSVLLFASGANTYSWFGGATTDSIYVSGLSAAGSPYTVTVIGACGKLYQFQIHTYHCESNPGYCADRFCFSLWEWFFLVVCLLHLPVEITHGPLQEELLTADKTATRNGFVGFCGCREHFSCWHKRFWFIVPDPYKPWFSRSIHCRTHRMLFGARLRFLRTVSKHIFANANAGSTYYFRLYQAEVQFWVRRIILFWYNGWTQELETWQCMKWMQRIVPDRFWIMMWSSIRVRNLQLSVVQHPCDNGTEIYTVPMNVGSTYNWMVTGGTITNISANQDSLEVFWAGSGSSLVEVKRDQFLWYQNWYDQHQCGGEYSSAAIVQPDSAGICQGGAFQISGNVNIGTIHWYSSGTGVFSDSTIASPQYISKFAGQVTSHSRWWFQVHRVKMTPRMLCCMFHLHL